MNFISLFDVIHDHLPKFSFYFEFLRRLRDDPSISNLNIFLLKFNMQNSKIAPRSGLDLNDTKWKLKTFLEEYSPLMGTAQAVSSSLARSFMHQLLEIGHLKGLKKPIKIYDCCLTLCSG
jgi:hypothetical protein